MFSLDVCSRRGSVLPLCTVSTSQLGWLRSRDRGRASPVPSPGCALVDSGEKAPPRYSSSTTGSYAPQGDLAPNAWQLCGASPPRCDVTAAPARTYTDREERRRKAYRVGDGNFKVACERADDKPRLHIELPVRACEEFATAPPHLIS